MAAHQPGPERQEVPLGPCGNQYLFRVDVHALEDHGELVHEGDVDIALRVFDDLCGFRDLDAGRLVRAGGYDACVDRIDEISHFRRRTRCHFQYRGQAMFLVARIDALRAVADEKILV